MKGKRYSEEQIFRILQEGDRGAKVAELCRQYGISENTYFRWKSKYSGLELSDLKRMKEIEGENSRLKRIVADQALQIDAMKEVLQRK
jgi:putative transposase